MIQSGKMIQFGDDHIRQEEPFFEAKKRFFQWCLQQEWNNENNIMFHVGDLFHRNLPTPKEINLAVDFIGNLKFKSMIFIPGNGQHEYNRQKKSYAIEAIESLPGVQVYYLPQTKTIGNTRILFLPWIPDNVYDDIPKMKEYYEKTLQDAYKEKTFDFVFGHFACKKFFDDEVDIDWIQGKKRMGHIHFPDETYLGINTITRSDEKGIPLNLDSIDLNTGVMSKIAIPRFLDYYDVQYPETVKDVEAELPVLEVFDAPSEEEARRLYSYEKQGKPIHFHRIHLKQQFNSGLVTTNTIEDKTTVSQYMEDFIVEKGVSDSVSKILRDKIKEVI